MTSNIRDLLEVLNDVHSNPDIQGEMQGDYLSAKCLLRSYEILNGKAVQPCCVRSG